MSCMNGVADVQFLKSADQFSQAQRDHILKAYCCDKNTHADALAGLKILADYVRDHKPRAFAWSCIAHNRDHVATDGVYCLTGVVEACSAEQAESVVEAAVLANVEKKGKPLTNAKARAVDVGAKIQTLEDLDTWGPNTSDEASREYNVAKAFKIGDRVELASNPIAGPGVVEAAGWTTAGKQTCGVRWDSTGIFANYSAEQLATAMPHTFTALRAHRDSQLFGLSLGSPAILSRGGA